RVFRGKPVVDGDDDGAGQIGHVDTGWGVAFNIPDDPTAAVKKDQHLVSGLFFGVKYSDRDVVRSRFGRHFVVDGPVGYHTGCGKVSLESAHFFIIFTHINPRCRKESKNRAHNTVEPRALLGIISLALGPATYPH